MKSSRSGKFFDGNIPFFLTLFVNCAILLSMLLVILLFIRNPNLPLQLDNSPRNFPLGSITAVYSPDTGVFLDFASWNSSYLLTSANFVVFLALFLGPELECQKERKRNQIRVLFRRFLSSSSYCKYSERYLPESIYNRAQWRFLYFRGFADGI